MCLIVDSLGVGDSTATCSSLACWLPCSTTRLFFLPDDLVTYTQCVPIISAPLGMSRACNNFNALCSLTIALNSLFSLSIHACRSGSGSLMSSLCVFGVLSYITLWTSFIVSSSMIPVLLTYASTLAIGSGRHLSKLRSRCCNSPVSYSISVPCPSLYCIVTVAE